MQDMLRPTALCTPDARAGLGPSEGLLALEYSGVSGRLLGRLDNLYRGALVVQVNPHKRARRAGVARRILHKPYKIELAACNLEDALVVID